MKSSVSAIKKYAELRISTVAGAWVFYFLTALLPLFFLLFTAFAVFGVNLTTELINGLPEEFKEGARVIMETAENASRGVTVFFVITVFFSGSALLNQMRKDCEYIYGIKSPVGGLTKRVWAVLALGVLFILFLGAAFLSAFERFLFSSLFTGGEKIWLRVGLFTVIIVFCFFLNAMLNAFVSPVRISFAQALTGSLASLSIIVVGTIGFTLYLRLFNPYNPVYGSLATAIVFLFWAYILMFGLICGVVVSKRAYFKSEKKSCLPINRQAGANNLP